MADVALVVAPHQDDAEIAMGGTIAALREQGVRVVIADLSDGEPTPFGSPEIRARETLAASRVLGIEERILVGLKNREIFDTVEARKTVASIMRQIQPTILFAPYWEDAHPDHVQASRLVDAARFYSKFVKSDLPYEPWYPKRQFYFFSTHMKVRIEPTFIFDISKFLEVKIASIHAFESQFVRHAANAERIAIIRNEALYWGAQIGVAAGEPFMCKENVRVASSQALFDL